MSLNRIWAIVLRYLYSMRHSYDAMSDMFYWPVIDLLLWGLTGKYFAESMDAGFTILTALMTGILFWLIIWRGQHEITVGLLAELWDRNFINLFVSPLQFWEWVSALLVIGIIKAFISFTFAVAAAFLLYHINIAFFGIYFIPFFVILIMFGWAVGLLISSLLMRYGTKVQTLAWTAVTLASPFAAVYYPVSVLPAWAQQVARAIPASYVFEGARSLIATGSVDASPLWGGFFLNLIYVALGLWALRVSFSRILGKGLISVD